MLAKALKGNASLKDIGITLSDITDAGVAKLAFALETVPNLRFVYLYSSGFKAATKVTDEGKAVLKGEGAREDGWGVCLPRCIPRRAASRTSSLSPSPLSPLASAAHLPPFACAALNHSVSRYLKNP